MLEKRRVATTVMIDITDCIEESIVNKRVVINEKIEKMVYEKAVEQLESFIMDNQCYENFDYEIIDFEIDYNKYQTQLRTDKISIGNNGSIDVEQRVDIMFYAIFTIALRNRDYYFLAPLDF